MTRGPLAGLLATLLWPLGARAAPSTVVTLSFDDVWADQLQAVGLLSAHGMHATFFIVSGWIGGPNHMTLGDIATLQQEGHEIAGHTVDHPYLTLIPPDQATWEICSDRAFLVDAGFAITSFAYPHGADNAELWQVVSDTGYNSARDIGGILMPTSCSGCPYAQAIPVPSGPGHEFDVFHTRTPDSIQTDTSLAQMESYVTQAEDHGGGWVQIVMHHVCLGTCDNSIVPYGVTVDQLNQFLDWLAGEVTSGNVAVLRTDEVIAGAAKPVVACQPWLPDGGPDAGSDAGSDAGIDAGADAGSVPYVALIDPTDGDTVSGTILLKALASSTLGIAQVVFVFNQDAGGVGTLRAGEYFFAWDANPPGQNVLIYAEATDTAGSHALSNSALVTVASPIDAGIQNDAGSNKQDAGASVGAAPNCACASTGPAEFLWLALAALPFARRATSRSGRPLGTAPTPRRSRSCS